MNKTISTKERILISLVGPSGSGKSFQPDFNKIYYFYPHYHSLYVLLSKDVKNIEFTEGVEFEFIQNFPNNDKVSVNV